MTESRHMEHHSNGQKVEKMYDELNMKLLLYTLSVMIVVAWALSYFVYSFEGTVHLLLLIALLLGVVGFLKKA